MYTYLPSIAVKNSFNLIITKTNEQQVKQNNGIRSYLNRLRLRRLPLQRNTPSSQSRRSAEMRKNLYTTNQTNGQFLRPNKISSSGSCLEQVSGQVKKNLQLWIPIMFLFFVHLNVCFPRE